MPYHKIHVWARDWKRHQIKDNIRPHSEYIVLVVHWPLDLYVFNCHLLFLKWYSNRPHGPTETPPWVHTICIRLKCAWVRIYRYCCHFEMFVRLYLLWRLSLLIFSRMSLSIFIEMFSRISWHLYRHRYFIFKISLSPIYDSSSVVAVLGLADVLFQHCQKCQ